MPFSPIATTYQTFVMFVYAEILINCPSAYSGQSTGDSMVNKTEMASVLVDFKF